MKQTLFHVQLERLIDEVLKSQDVQHLDAFLEGDLHEVCPMMCSQQFLTKLDKLIIQVRCIPEHYLICSDALL